MDIVRITQFGSRREERRRPCGDAEPKGRAEIHRHRLIGKDQPIVVTIVDTEESLARLIPEVEAMMDTGMIATSNVECIRIENPH